ncbi:unnamed protein product [marine sediment metagenome]|uniref:Uncharacterized protein n=1 Tax=marine sediment metagenome TaxID=412755 RepID=X1C8Z3_9ZZZZ
MKFHERIKNKEDKEKALKSANLCLDGAIKQLKKGKSPNSYLHQFCLQFKKYCKLEKELHKAGDKKWKQMIRKSMKKMENKKKKSIPTSNI